MCFRNQTNLNVDGLGIKDENAIVTVDNDLYNT